jgi:hypothetical protein
MRKIISDKDFEDLIKLSQEHREIYGDEETAKNLYNVTFVPQTDIYDVKSILNIVLSLDLINKEKFRNLSKKNWGRKNRYRKIRLKFDHHCQYFGKAKPK